MKKGFDRKKRTDTMNKTGSTDKPDITGKTGSMGKTNTRNKSNTRGSANTKENTNTKDNANGKSGTDMNGKSGQKTVRMVLRLVRRLEPHFLPTLVLTKLLASVYPFALLWFGSRILDMVIERRGMSEIMRTVLAMAICNFIVGHIRWWLETSVLPVQRRVISQRVSQMVPEKSLQLDYELLEKQETLDLIYKANEGIANSGGITAFCEQLGELIGFLTDIVYSFALFIGVCVPVKAAGGDALTQLLNSRWSVLFLAALVCFQLIARSALQKENGRQGQLHFERSMGHKRRSQYFSEFTSRYRDGKDIRLYQTQDMILDGLRGCNENQEANDRIMLRWERRYTVLNRLLLFVLLGGSYLYVGLKAITGLISVGSVLRYVGAFQQFCSGLTGVMGMYLSVEIQSKYLAMFDELMQLENRKYEGTLPVEKRDDNRYEIEFRDVSFRYPNGTGYVLSHVNTKLRIGEKTAIVGPNGAGKTTFIKLLCRLYDPTEGEILLNGINIKLYDYQEYLSLFSVVFQDFRLFAFSLAENVAASEEYDEDKIAECIRVAGLGERLKKLPDGIRTLLYQLQENGVEISGGEAQKLAIARALYKDAAFVILDEPTSALDPVSEYEIYKRFDDLVKEKTAVYISHRMSSCRFCDNIFVFDGGQIVQRGSHESLMGEDGLYRALWSAQAQYYQ